MARWVLVEKVQPKAANHGTGLHSANPRVRPIGFPFVIGNYVVLSPNTRQLEPPREPGSLFTQFTLWFCLGRPRSSSSALRDSSSLTNHSRARSSNNPPGARAKS